MYISQYQTKQSQPDNKLWFINKLWSDQTINFGHVNFVSI